MYWAAMGLKKAGEDKYSFEDLIPKELFFTVCRIFTLVEKWLFIPHE